MDHSKTYHYDDLGLGLPRIYQPHNGLYSAGYFLCCVFMVICSNPNNSDLKKKEGKEQFPRGATSTKGVLHSMFVTVGGSWQPTLCFFIGCRFQVIDTGREQLRIHQRMASLEKQQAKPHTHPLPFFTLGFIFSSSPFFNLHRTCAVVSPPIPKFSACSGEKSSRHICNNHKKLAAFDK